MAGLTRAEFFDFERNESREDTTNFDVDVYLKSVQNPDGSEALQP